MENDDVELDEGLNDETPNEETKPDPLAALKAANKQLADMLNNFKSEVTRKLDNIKTLAAPAPEKKRLADVLFEDDDQAESIIDEKVNNAIAAREQRQSKEQQQVIKLVRDFPELSNAGDPLTLKAQEIYASYSEEEKASATAMRAAVTEAALELGVAPKSKRKRGDDESDDTFALSGGSRTPGSKSSRRRKTEIADETLEAAQLLGLDIMDEKTVNNLKQHAERDSWTSYRKPYGTK